MALKLGLSHTNGRIYIKCENRVLRIFGPKRKGIAGGWRRLHNEEFHNLYVSTGVVMLIKSRRMTWAGHVSCIGERRNEYKFL
jgi:hypothetical protein